jgi:hypothetical protein
MAGRKAKTRVVYRQAVKKAYRKSSSGLSSVKKLLNPIMIGLGASMVGNVIGQRVGINPIIPSAVAGFIGGGKIGAVTAVALPMIMNQGLNIFSTGVKNESPSGTVWS